MSEMDRQSVTLCNNTYHQPLADLLGRYTLTIEWVAKDEPIPGSHFGDPEAGLIGSALYLRQDTPIHSALHEACHFICMDKTRRSQLHTDAGGNYDEENAVCYLSIILADHIEGFGSQKMMADMDTWGYTFRLGDARSWFTRDAADAKKWLSEKYIIDVDDSPTWRLGDE